MGVAPFFLWSYLGLSVFSKTCFRGLEGDFCGQKEEGGLEGCAFMPLLNSLQGKK